MGVFSSFLFRWKWCQLNDFPKQFDFAARAMRFASCECTATIFLPQTKCDFCWMCSKGEIQKRKKPAKNCRISLVICIVHFFARRQGQIHIKNFLSLNFTDGTIKLQENDIIYEIPVSRLWGTQTISQISMDIRRSKWAFGHKCTLKDKRIETIFVQRNSPAAVNLTNTPYVIEWSINKNNLLQSGKLVLVHRYPLLFKAIISQQSASDFLHFNSHLLHNTYIQTFGPLYVVEKKFSMRPESFAQ